MFLCLRAHAQCKLGIRFVVLLALVALSGLSRGAAAATPHWSPGLRAGTAQPGAQQTLKGGLELGLVVDRITGGAVDFGFGLGYVRDNSGASGSLGRVGVLSMEGHARTAIKGHRPYLELGVGLYSIEREAAEGQDGGASSVAGLGALMGGGFEVFRAADSGLAVELGILYHAIAAEVSASGGNLEDYYAAGATIRWGVR